MGKPYSNVYRVATMITQKVLLLETQRHAFAILVGIDII